MKKVFFQPIQLGIILNIIIEYAVYEKICIWKEES